MIKREKSKSLLTIIGSLLIIISIFIFASYHIYNFYINNQEEEMVNKFLKDIQESEITTDNSINLADEKEVNNEIIYNYIGVLEIPKIDFKRGFLSIDDKNNNVNKNIQIISGSSMPDTDNSLLIIAGHSGNGRTAFFRNIDKLNTNDEIYIYYGDIKYIYQVKEKYEEEKDGNISINKNDKSTLVLTTCSQTNDNKQVVLISTLINKINY